MDTKPKKQIVILSESMTASFAKDVVTFLMFGGLMYFNHRVLSGNGWIDAMFIAMIFMYIATKNNSQVFSGTREEAIKWMQDKDEEDK